MPNQLELHTRWHEITLGTSARTQLAQGDPRLSHPAATPAIMNNRLEIANSKARVQSCEGEKLQTQLCPEIK